MKIYRLPIVVAALRLVIGIVIALNPDEGGWSGLYFLILDFPGVILYGPLEKLMPSLWACAFLGTVWWYFFVLFIEYCFLKIRGTQMIRKS